VPQSNVSGAFGSTLPAVASAVNTSNLYVIISRFAIIIISLFTSISNGLSSETMASLISVQLINMKHSSGVQVMVAVVPSSYLPSPLIVPLGEDNSIVTLKYFIAMKLAYTIILSSISTENGFTSDNISPTSFVQ